MTISAHIREAQINADLSRWSTQTQELIRSGDHDACSVFNSYKNFMLRGEFDHIEMFVDPSKVSIDVGTNRGQYALKLASISKGCLCIEPVKALGFVAKVLPNNCVYRSVAAGRARGVATIRIPSINGTFDYGQSTLATDNTLGGNEYEEQTTEVTTVDELVQECFPGEAVGFVKIDVEGFEEAVLEGSSEMLKRCKPNLQIELHGGNKRIEWVTNFLGQLGYRGLFFFDGRLFDASLFDFKVHRATENEYNWRTKKGLKFDPARYVCDYIFIPIEKQMQPISVQAGQLADQQLADQHLPGNQKNELAENQHLLKENERLLIEQERLMAELLDSASWRITRPLRWGYEQLLKLKKS